MITLITQNHTILKQKRANIYNHTQNKSLTKILENYKKNQTIFTAFIISDKNYYILENTGKLYRILTCGKKTTKYSLCRFFEKNDTKDFEDLCLNIFYQIQYFQHYLEHLKNLITFKHFAESENIIPENFYKNSKNFLYQIFSKDTNINFIPPSLKKEIFIFQNKATHFCQSEDIFRDLNSENKQDLKTVRTSGWTTIPLTSHDKIKIYKKFYQKDATKEILPFNRESLKNLEEKIL